MARINIEDSLYRDIRFISLVGKLGSVEMALGSLFRAYALAQEWFLSDETARLIPLSKWKQQLIKDEIIEVGLAEVRGEYVYVAGSEVQFAWLLQKSEAGKQGGRPKKKAYETGRFSNESERNSPESGSKPLTLSLPLSHNTKEPSGGGAAAPPAKKKANRTPPNNPHFGTLVGNYVDFFKGKYGGAEPDRGEVAIACLKRVFNSNGYERTRNLLEVYFQIEDAWIKRKHHDMATFEKCINQLSVAMTKGSEMTQVNWEEVVSRKQLGGANGVPGISSGNGPTQ